MQRRVVFLAATAAALVLVSGGGAVTDQLRTEGADNIEVEARCSANMCSFEIDHVGTRPQFFVAIDLPEGLTVIDVSASGGAQCAFEDRFALCRWRAADGGPNFPAGATRTIDVETSTRIDVGTTVEVCSSGHPDFEEYFCTAPQVMAAAADLALELFSNPTTETRQRRSDPFPRARYRVVVTNHGPVKSPAAKLRFVSNQPMFAFHAVGPKRKISGCTARGRVWTCQVAALAPGETAVIGLSAIPISDSGKRPGVVTTVGTVTGALPDPVPANNRDSTKIRVK